MSDELRDDGLSRLYREAGQPEPPPALDAAILAAARAAATPAPRRRPGWRVWALPVSAAATVVLTATLTLMVRQEQERAAPAVAPAQAPTAPPAEASSMDVPEARKAKKTDAPASTPAMTEPMRAPAAAPAPPVTAERRQSGPAAESDAVELRAKSVAPPRNEAVGAAAPARTPEQWLEEIRRLKQQGRQEEAAEALAAFRRAYPDYGLPEDLR